MPGVKICTARFTHKNFSNPYTPLLLNVFFDLKKCLYLRSFF